MVGAGIVRAAAKLYYLRRLADLQAVPIPRDVPESRSGADDPDRVLLIGNGPAVGWGTVTHDLALTGQLARSLARRTERPTDVRYIGDETMSIGAVVPWLGDHPLARYDLVALVLSLNDALRLTPAHEYRADMERVLMKLAAETRPSARIVVAAIHPVGSLRRYGGPLSRFGQGSVDRLNAVMRELVGQHDGMEFVELEAPAPEPGREYGSAQMYADWSQRVADDLAPALDAARLLDPDRAVLPVEDADWAWRPGRRIIEERPESGWQRLDELVAQAKQELGVDVVYVSLMDGDRQHFAANTAQSSGSVPLELSYCKLTMEGDAPVEIRNAKRDERFRHNPLIDVNRLTYYAGAPMRNEEGENVGTFCVQTALPTSSRSVPLDRLQEFARLAQTEVQRIAADRAGGDLPVADPWERGGTARR